MIVTDLLLRLLLISLVLWSCDAFDTLQLTVLSFVLLKLNPTPTRRAGCAEYEDEVVNEWEWLCYGDPAVIIAIPVVLEEEEDDMVFEFAKLLLVVSLWWLLLLPL